MEPRVAGHFDELMLRAAAIATLTITPSKLNEPDIVEAAKAQPANHRACPCRRETDHRKPRARR
jgi:hypothetical protein